MGELTRKDYLDETWISFALFLAVIPMIYNISLAMNEWHYQKEAWRCLYTNLQSKGRTLKYYPKCHHSCPMSFTDIICSHSAKIGLDYLLNCLSYRLCFFPYQISFLFFLQHHLKGSTKSKLMKEILANKWSNAFMLHGGLAVIPQTFLNHAHRYQVKQYKRTQLFHVPVQIKTDKK